MKIVARVDLTSSEQVASRVKPDMDPRLQLLLTRRRAGMTQQASASTDVDEVAVIARVDGRQKWLALGEVRSPTVIGATEDREHIVTGRIPIQRIERVRGQPFVKSLKAARPVRPMLSETTGETEANPQFLPSGHHTSGGKGVVVGIVDYGGDFAHQDFRHGNGRTRLLYLWDQNGGNSPASPSPYGYGREHAAAELNLALAQSNPYEAIGYDPADYDPGTGAHGTHVMDIAAGNGRGTTVPGMAPAADLIFVNITHARDPEGETAVGQSFGDSVTLLESLKYIFDKSGNKPTVINVSLGTNDGPHDGSTLVEQGIDTLVSAAPNRAVVIAASNSYDDGIHATGTLNQGGTIDLVWDVAGQLGREIELEVWYEGVDRIKVDLIAPNGILLASARPGENKQVLSGGVVVAFVANRLNDPNNHDNMIGVYLAAGMPAGNYLVRLTGETISNGRFHAWIERDNSFQSSFLPPFDNSHTIGSVSCGKKLIAVGSYDAHVPERPLSYFSSAGPTRDGRKKPEVSAPGHGVWAARSSTGTDVTRKSGTSMAAPAVAGLVALLFEEAAARGIQLTAEQTIEILVDTARSAPPPGAAWHDRYGFGRVSASSAIAAVLNLPSVPTPAGTAVVKASATPKKKGVPKKKPK